MNIGEITVNETFEARDRNVEIRISSPFGAEMQIDGLDELGNPITITVPNPNIDMHRERVLIKDGAKVHVEGHVREYHVNKNLSEIVAESVTLPMEMGGITLTAGQIAIAIEMLTDRFAEIGSE